MALGGSGCTKTTRDRSWTPRVSTRRCACVVLGGLAVDSWVRGARVQPSHPTHSRCTSHQPAQVFKWWRGPGVPDEVYWMTLMQKYKWKSWGHLLTHMRAGAHLTLILSSTILRLSASVPQARWCGMCTARPQRSRDSTSNRPYAKGRCSCHLSMRRKHLRSHGIALQGTLAPGTRTSSAWKMFLICES